MAKQKSLKVNFIMNAILTMSSFIFPLITFPYVSRILMPSGVGKVNFATSVINYFSMIAQLGIPTYGIRACARVRDDREKLTRTAHELLFINIVIVQLCFIRFPIQVQANSPGFSPLDKSVGNLFKNHLVFQWDGKAIVEERPVYLFFIYIGFHRSNPFLSFITRLRSIPSSIIIHRSILNYILHL